MVETLTKFKMVNPANLSVLLAGITLMWLIWPILCGVLGARRGHGMSGVMHGLMWGPLGLVPVLLTSRKRCCPTCGKMTLTDAHGAADASPAMSSEIGRAVSDPIGPVPPVAYRASGAASVAVAHRADKGRTRDEGGTLLAWVNGELPRVPEAARQRDDPFESGAELPAEFPVARAATRSSV